MFRLAEARSARSTGSASTTTASSASSPTSTRARYRGILGINIGKNFDTPNERAADDYVACLRAVYAHAQLRHRQHLVAEHEGPARPAGGRARSPRCWRALKREQASARAASTAGTCRSSSRSRPISTDGAIGGIARLLVEHRHRRRDRDQHDARARRRRGPAACRRSGRPVGRAAARALDGGDARRWRRRSTARCRSSASAASCRGADAREKIDAGATLVQLYTGLIYRGPGSRRRVRDARSRQPD